jgi:hypothetical protein
MDCRTPIVGWMFHDWAKMLIYPALLSDGVGGYWACHLLRRCRTCGKRDSLGIWVCEETEGYVRYWYVARAATPREIEQDHMVWEAHS